MNQKRFVPMVILSLTTVVIVGLLLSVYPKGTNLQTEKPFATTFESYRIILNKSLIVKLQKRVYRVGELRIPLDNEDGERIRRTVISDLSGHIASEKAKTYHHELRFRIYYCDAGKARTFKTSYFSESDQIYETPTADLGGENGPPFETLPKLMLDAVCK